MPQKTGPNYVHGYSFREEYTRGLLNFRLRGLTHVDPVDASKKSLAASFYQVVSISFLLSGQKFSWNVQAPHHSPPHPLLLSSSHHLFCHPAGMARRRVYPSRPASFCYLLPLQGVHLPLLKVRRESY